MVEVGMNTVVIVGGGGHAKVLASVLKKLGCPVAGYTDPRNHGALLGAPYLGTDDVLRALAGDLPHAGAAIGVGKVDASDIRITLATRVRALGFTLPAIVSPEAIVNEEVELSEGTVVFDGAVINAGTIVDRLCIINTNSTVDHDCLLGENVHIASGATVSGGVTIGPHCLIGAGSTLVHSISVCSGCLIGAGTIVADNITIPGTYVGNPARRIRDVP